MKVTAAPPPEDDDEELVRAAARLVNSPRFASVKPSKVAAYYDVNEGPMRPGEQELFTRVVNAAWLAHISGKGVSVTSIISEDRSLPPQKVRELVQTPRFKKAAKERGLPTAHLDGLSPEMVAALRTVADPTLNEMSERKRVEALGITWQEYQGWMDYPPFREKYRLLMGKMLDVAVDKADMKLAELIESGNLKAIEYANEKTGRFVRGSQQQQDFNQMVLMVLSVLTRHITNPDELKAVSTDLSAMLVAGASTVPSITRLEPHGNNDDSLPGDDASGAGFERAVLDDAEQQQPDPD